MTQTYGSIGSESPELHAETEKRHGWDDSTDTIPQIDQLRSHDSSFWNDRANLQQIGKGSDGNYAQGLYQDPTSYQQAQGNLAFQAEAGYANDQGGIRPFTGYSEDGIITADQVSPSLPPGAPTVAEQPAGNQAGGSPYP
jgi:hypothetical protein